MEKNLDKIREAAIKGNAEAQYQFAVETWRYDEQYALKYFLHAAENGNADAINSLKKGGVFIYFVRNHVEDAIVFFEELANKGDAEAMKCVGDCYSRREPNLQWFKMPFLPISSLLTQGNTSCMSLHKCLDMNKNCYFKLLRTHRN